MGILRILTYVVLSCCAVSFLQRWHWIFVVLAVTIAICNVAAVWMLRRHRRIVAACCDRDCVRNYISIVCRLTNDSLPRRTDSEPAEENRLRLRTKKDFDAAAANVKSFVRGHDSIIDRLFVRVLENVTLRKSRKHRHGTGPLASFLLVGPEGIGKRYLAKVVAWQLYGNGGIERFDSAELTVASLVGTRIAKGDLLQAIERTPCTLILFERIEKAVPDVVQLLVQLLTTGKVYLTDSQTAVSFEDATLVFTTDAIPPAWSAADSATNVNSQCVPALSELLASDLEIDPSLLNALTEILPCESPSDCVKAEVVALAMKQECSAHELELSNVDPEILASLVMLFDDSSGFRLLPHRVKKLLRQPLVAASAQQHTSLSLRVRHREIS